MTFASAPPPRSPQGPRAPRPPARRRPHPLAVTAVVVGLLVVALLTLSQVWTEFLWFGQLGFTRVLVTEWVTRGVLFLLAAVVMAGAVAVNLSVGYRSRPVYAPSTQEQASLDQYREAIEPLRRVVMVVGPAVLGLFAGAAASQQWQTVQLAINGGDVGTRDPQFGLDVGFYLFTLPAVRFVVSFLLAVAVIAGIAGLITQYLYGGVRVGGPQGAPRTTRAARAQLCTVGAVVLLLVAANYFLDRYSLLTKESGNGRFFGASYTDVQAVIPARGILAGAGVLVALVFVYAAFRGSWRLPLIGVGIMVVSGVALGGIYPAVVERLQVSPNQQDVEAPYIERNIAATRAAYGLDAVDTQTYSAATTAEAGQLREDAETAAQIRLLDPQVVAPSFRQLQQVRAFYDFPETLAVDKYEIDGESRDTVIAVRELNINGLNDAQRNWTNDVTVYTHGFGVVAASGNQVAANGGPSFWEGGLPTTGDMGEYEPRIYFSPEAPAYSIVGAPEGRGDWELDYPDDESGGAVNTTFPTEAVSAGPSVGNLWNKLLYALKFGATQILLSDRVTTESQIIYDRDPRERVEKVAPFLTLDGRVYPAVVDDKVVWILDGYTTSNQYPYSAQRSLDDATEDALTGTAATVQALAPEQVNYIRNSVKVTVDAYSGDVTLYAWDDTDPILRAWQRVFPSEVQPLSAISGELMSHIRYPEDLFKVQRDLLGQYHVTEADQFFSGNDFWTTPDDPSTDREVNQPPYYLTLQMPGQEQPTFSLTTSFIPSGANARNVLTGYLAADSDAGDQAGVKGERYGTLRLLELPRDSTVPGPGQVANNFNTDPDVSTTLNILAQRSTTVVRGNLLTLPVAGGLLYVQPVYVQAASGTSFPLLQRVLVAFGDEIGFASTLDEALDQVFGGDSGFEGDGTGQGEAPDTGSEVPDPGTGTDPGDGTDPGTDPGTTDPGTGTGDPGSTADARTRLADALASADAAIQAAQAALTAGDFAAYGEAQAQLDQAIQDAIAAEAELDAAARGATTDPSASTSPSPDPSASASP
ncbi:UPF0182 family protein [Cellulomonas marina]|uniref:UPF0182 protein SAMN05421867_11479 n=1 Tax=Cellulomonas marina TaxID=988821 RepID=A0A1I1A485_9CELL|nr:UPF0182 family protein [Cellulomonas marina]GIG30465.1 UPF0182 protein [Cellulomonas marina]SFB32156.1 hypothetical protein SAMN05421867_11479 [Cellulomonas marina]